MQELKVISLSHKQIPLEVIGQFHVEADRVDAILADIRHRYLIDEIFYLSTCNRIELVFVFNAYLCSGLSTQLLQEFFQGEAEEFPETIKSVLEIHHGLDALRHLMRVGSSLESMLVGEQEIITQLRKAYETSTQLGHTGDLLRLGMKKVVETAKKCFSKTGISSNPVSVAFLAWQKLKNAGLKPEDPVLLVGAGQTMGNVARFMRKFGCTDVTVANRSLENAQSLAQNWNAIALEELSAKQRVVRALVVCTGAQEPVITPEVFDALTGGQPFRGVVVDLGLPADVDASIPANHPLTYIDMVALKREADANVQKRLMEVDACESIIERGLEEFELNYQHRQVEIAMREIPAKIKEIKATALGDIFASDLENLDEHSVEVLIRILDYMEKKYISVPMKMAREVIMDSVQKN